MNSVERVKNLCKERKIPISRLEKELGFANGYINQLRKGVFPSDRLKQISEYFGVSVDYLLGNADKQPKMLIKTSHWKSNKASRLYMCIDSDLLDSLDLLAKAANASLEDEVEKILHEEVERRIEEETCETFLSVAPGALEIGSKQQKKPTPVTEDGLDEMFMRYVQELTPNQQLMILDQMQWMTGQQKEPSSVFAQQITGETTP